MLDVTPYAWDGTTYYGREQLKASPFNKWLVGGYTFLSGLSGAAVLLSALIDLTRGDRAKSTVRLGRWLGLLAPTIGTALLIADLHTPRRFYQMLRVFKVTSPMSIGSWTLVSFGLFSSIAAAGDLVSRFPGLGWVRGAARAAQVPAAVTGATLSTYTAGLLSATSTPLWAAAPGATAVRFGASSIAAAAAALGLGAGAGRISRDLDRIALAALTVELAATISADESYHRTGIAEAMRTAPGQIEELGGTVLGTLLPIALLALPDSGRASALGRLAILAGAVTMRVAFIAAGNCSAQRPEISLRFAQKANLPLMRGIAIRHRV